MNVVPHWSVEACLHQRAGSASRCAHRSCWRIDEWQLIGATQFDRKMWLADVHSEHVGDVLTERGDSEPASTLVHPPGHVGVRARL
ncbi:hypothetical protein QN239_33410 [Mycolicibacterium sp. Y3]